MYKSRSEIETKKILFVATLDSFFKQFLLPYLKLFKDNGYEVHIMSGGDEEIPYCDKKFKLSFERSPYRFSNLKAYKELKKIMDIEKYTIINCNNPMCSIITRLAATRTRKVNNTKVIYTAHGFHFYKGAPLKNWMLYYPVEKLVASKTDCIITINKEDYEFASKKLKAKEIRYTNGVGVNFEKFNINMSEIEKGQLREKLGLKKDDYVMLFVAELNSNKNQKMILKSMAELKNKYNNIHIVFAGTGTAKGYLDMAKELGIYENVHIIGYSNEVEKIFKISDLVVSSSRREGLPINIMEAMVSLLPTVVTNCRGNRDLIKDEYNGYVVEIDDYIRMAERIEYLYNNRDIAKKMGENNKKIYTKYLIENVLKEYIKIYNELDENVKSNEDLQVQAKLV